MFLFKKIVAPIFFPVSICLEFLLLGLILLWFTRRQMAKDAKISKVSASVALDSFISGVTKTLHKKDGKVTLPGFGTFAKDHRKARKGRNPQTGAIIKIKAGNVVKFKAGKKLKDAI